MSHWNYRVVPFVFDHGDYSERWVEIREVHYNDDGNPVAVSDSSGAPMGEDVDQLLWTLQMMGEAAMKPLFIPPEPWGVEHIDRSGLTT